MEQSINQLNGLSSVELDVNNGEVQVAFNKDAVTNER